MRFLSGIRNIKQRNRDLQTVWKIKSVFVTTATNYCPEVQLSSHCFGEDHCQSMPLVMPETEQQTLLAGWHQFIGVQTSPEFRPVVFTTIWYCEYQCNFYHQMLCTAIAKCLVFVWLKPVFTQLVHFLKMYLIDYSIVTDFSLQP